jgi:ATP phosphoribosyltransferase
MARRKSADPAADQGLTLAVSKGRILDETLPMLARLGITPDEDPASSRRLILPTSRPGLCIVVIRAQDVPTYVDYGAADLGIAGKDVLMEYQGEGLYEPLDLRIARCRLVLAGRKGAPTINGRRRVATKYVHTARRFFAERGEQVEIIKLYGSMELAPLVGLADQIIDLVDTGNTLKANGLVPVETIAEISSRLIVNKAAMKVKHRQLKAFIAQVGNAVGH